MGVRRSSSIKILKNESGAGIPFSTQPTVNLTPRGAKKNIEKRLDLVPRKILQTFAEQRIVDKRAKKPLITHESFPGLYEQCAALFEDGDDITGALAISVRLKRGRRDGIYPAIDMVVSKESEGFFGIRLELMYPGHPNIKNNISEVLVGPSQDKVVLGACNDLQYWILKDMHGYMLDEKLIS